MLWCWEARSHGGIRDVFRLVKHVHRRFPVCGQETTSDREGEGPRERAMDAFRGLPLLRSREGEWHGVKQGGEGGGVHEWSLRGAPPALRGVAQALRPGWRLELGRSASVDSVREECIGSCPRIWLRLRRVITEPVAIRVARAHGLTGEPTSHEPQPPSHPFRGTAT